MSATPAAAGAPHHSETVAVEAERRWAIVVGVIIAAIVLMMIVTGLHWAAMPPSRVETIDVKTLHLSGEFVEGQLGTTLDADGKVMVRLIAQQYSFEPQCIVVPADMPVTFRGTAARCDPRLRGRDDQREHHAHLRLRRHLHHHVPEAGRAPDAVPQFCGTGHEAMWARVQVLPREEFLAKARGGERLACVPR